MKLNKKDDLFLHRLADIKPEEQRDGTYNNYVYCYLLGRQSVFSEMTDKALAEKLLIREVNK